MKYFWKSSEDVSCRLLGAPRLLVALDFDGTLAALAESPDRARLKPDFKIALKALAALYGVYVFILSGRSLRSVCGLIGLRNIYYGGNHGIEIRGPGYAWRDAAAAKMQGAIAEIAADLGERFPPGTGVLVENKLFSASIHYRNIKTAFRRGFFSRMKALTSESHSGIRWSSGHEVFELLPKGAAHKGHALTRLAKELNNPLCIAVGDDLTDEDMFEAIAGHGIAIRVGSKSGSKAGYFLSGQSEVLRLLRFIIDSRRWDVNWRRELWNHSDSARV